MVLMGQMQHMGGKHANPRPTSQKSWGKWQHVAFQCMTINCLILWGVIWGQFSNCDWLHCGQAFSGTSFTNEGRFDSLRNLTGFGERFFSKARKAVDILSYLQRRVFCTPPMNSVHAWHVAHAWFNCCCSAAIFQTWVGVVSVRAPFQDCMHALTLMIKSQGHPTCLHGVIQVFWWVLSESWSWVRVIQNCLLRSFSYKFT